MSYYSAVAINILLLLLLLNFSVSLSRKIVIYPGVQYSYRDSYRMMKRKTKLILWLDSLIKTYPSMPISGQFNFGEAFPLNFIGTACMYRRPSTGQSS